MAQPINVPVNAVVTPSSLAAVRAAFAKAASAYNVLPPPVVPRYTTAPGQMPYQGYPTQTPPPTPAPKPVSIDPLGIAREFRLGRHHAQVAPLEAPFIFGKRMAAVNNNGLGTQAGLEGAAGAAGIAVGAVVMAFNKIADVAKTLADYSAKSNPAAAKMLSEAFDDMQAVIGSRFTPVVKFATQAVRLIGDFLQTVLPTEQQFEAVVAELKPVMDELKAVMIDIAPYVQTFFVTALKMLALTIRDTVNAIITAINTLKIAAKFTFGSGMLKMLGFDTTPISPIKGLQSSFGAAAREANYISNEEVGRRAVLNAFNRGFGVNWQEKTAIATEEINQKMDKLLEPSGPGGNGGVGVNNWKGANDFGFVPPPAATSV